MMNIDKLKEFNRALANLSDEIKDMTGDMTSCIQPRHDCSGGFIGLVWNVSSNLEEIEDFYDEILKYDYYGDDYDECFDDHNNSYMSIIWSDALSKFLGFNDSDDLSNWAKENPKLWGCKHGSTMFFSSYSYLADDVVVDKFTLTHRDIINWWAQVEKNIETS